MKRKIKKRTLIIFTILIFIIILSITTSRFNQIKNLNKQINFNSSSDEVFEFNEEIVLTSNTIKESNITRIVKYPEIKMEIESMYNKYNYTDFTKKRVINLNCIDNKSYNQLKIINIHSKILLKNTNNTIIQINNNIDEFLLTPENIKTYLEKNVEKNEKVLFYCLGGGYSSVMAFIAYSLGYDAYFTKLSYLEKSKYLDLEFIKQETINNAIITLPYNQIDKYKNKISIVFGGTQQDLIKLLKPNNITKIYYKNYQKNKLLESSIVCTNNLNCLITKHFLYSINLSYLIKQIYFYEDQDKYSN